MLKWLFGKGEHRECRHDQDFAAMRVLLHNQGRMLMALSEEVKAAVAEIGAKIDAAVAGIGEAVADINGLHAKLDELLNQGDVAGAQAALAEAQAKASALSDAVAGLKVVVDLPE